MTQPAMPSPLVSDSDRCSTPRPERAPASSVVRDASKRRMLAWSHGRSCERRVGDLVQRVLERAPVRQVLGELPQDGEVAFRVRGHGGA